MPATPLFATLVPIPATPLVAPVPMSPGETYLLGLLDSKRALQGALNALIARASVADSSETEYIEIQKGNIKADYLKLNSMVTAYLTANTIFKPIDDTDLKAIRAIIDRLQGFTAKKEKATEIMKAVTELLTQWSPAVVPNAAHN